MYDSTSEHSFSNVKQWLQEISRYAGEPIEKVLVGNKCEQTTRKEVNYTTAKHLADDLGMNFMETSAKSGTNINELFISFANQLLRNKANTINDKQVNITDKLRLEKKQKATSFCSC
jgi:Ras-related protein Rab-1A